VVVFMVRPVVGHGKRLVVADGVVGGVVIVGIVGSAALVPTVPAKGDTVGVGTAGVPPTPRLLISVESNGIPVRATPPGVVGAVEVGVDDDATLPEPEPHIPDIPAVSNVPEVIDTPDVPRGSEEFESPDDADITPLAVPAVAGAPVPTPIPIPPPSKLVVDPNIVDGEVPTVEHAVPLLVLGIVIVPVTPVGVGLSPPDRISVDPSGIPVGPTGVPGAEPNGEVALSVGVVGSAPTCAMALLQATSAGSTTAINVSLTVIPSRNPRRRSENHRYRERVLSAHQTGFGFD
jgi:hypothetical protein